MTTHIRPLIAGVALAGAFAAPAMAQDLPVGTWTGTVRNMNAAQRNQNPRPASLIVKKVADPHVRWRGGSGDLLVVTLTLQQQSYEVGSVEFNDLRMVLSFTQPSSEEPVQCLLPRQKDGSYEGDCTGGLTRRVMLAPPVSEK